MRAPVPPAVSRWCRGRWARRSIRLRLTLTYGALFLVSGAGLLTITYFLVRGSTNGVFVAHGTPGGGTRISIVAPATVRDRVSVPLHLPSQEIGHAIAQGSGAAPPSPAQAQAMARRLIAQANAYHGLEMHNLLLYSCLALVIMAAISLVLGWMVAGRVLRPLRHMTGAVREISATSLHERLDLHGPDDELKELAGTFDDLLTRLERSFRAQRQFVANASHELRTPLARQKTVAQVALADTDASVASLRRAHERVLASGEQQERLIEALLTLTRGQAGTERRDHFDLATLAEEVVLSREGDAARRDVGVVLHLAPAPATGDPRLVERMIANVLDNALRYNVAQGRVVVRTNRHGERARVSVSNTGPPVSTDEVRRIVEPFTRLGGDRARDGDAGRDGDRNASRNASRDGSRSADSDGLGLGLSIVQAVADAHDAVLTIRPRLSGGLEVVVDFPVDRPTREEPEKRATPGPKRPAGDPHEVTALSDVRA